ncbi:hypothetical protein ASF84_02320 [Pseudomonas sp. Leaf127]|uniref:NEL-type E3 ubiquitin ligase domain-containing protein n=1 Tax=Pseudomonas sp. Leaf127 TaxID=1736267 RepID=UPI000703BB12|nr:NEL-type E3 ubiquitin ligase domain-containing protein [Pseudomonas sp. Leaf127]KQQ67992.1 hypothetical protein ASF84_02320 [Pseudomonas sp. Leaf127]
MDMDTPTATTPPAVHQPLIATHVPAWLRQAPAGTHAALRRARQTATDRSWLAAQAGMPGVAAQLHRQYNEHRQLQQRVAPHLAQLGTLQDFAEPRLKAALKARFGLDLDVRNTWLLHASHALTDPTFMGASKDPLIEANKALRGAIRPLLDAALQNFQAADTQPGAMDHDTQLKAAVFSQFEILGPGLRGTPLAIAAHEFAALARDLDLGGQYQAHIDRVLTEPVMLDMQAMEGSAFILHTHLARLRQRIDAVTHQALLSLADPAATGPAPECCTLGLWDTGLTDILVIFTEPRERDLPQPVTVYIPEDPVAPLITYASLDDFHDALRNRLFDERYRNFFSRFIPARQRARLMNRLHRQLFPEVWQGPLLGPGYYAEQADPDARLKGGGPVLTGPVFQAMYQRKLEAIKDNARFHGVPTAEQDARSASERRAWWRDLALNTLNVAAFFVPVLGEVMLAVTVAQLGYEVFEGIESWTEGEKDQALTYLVDVVQNLALITALGSAAGQAGKLPAIEAPAWIGALEPVTLPGGAMKLWKPDLAPFAHDIVLPAGLKSDASGLIPYKGKHWLVLEGRPYSVRPARNSEGHVFEHPRNPLGHEPEVRHNGHRAWLSTLEHPEQMQGLTLMRRLGYLPGEFSNITVRMLLKVSGVPEMTLRRALSEGERPAALLMDTAERFELYQHLDEAGQLEQFQPRYQALQTPDDALLAALQQRLPAPLPRAVAEELLTHATAAERAQLAEGGKIPLRLAEEARVYAQQVRLARAYEGLYLQGLRNPDTDRLALHGLERLPDWPADIRLEVRDGHAEGALIDSIGAPEAPVRQVLIRTLDGYAVAAAQAPGPARPMTLFAAIADALPPGLREDLALSATEAGNDLRILLGHPPLPRRIARTVLGMQPVKPGFRSPMRLADGRLGYPLSGRGLPERAFTRETLLDKIRLLELEDLYPDELFEQLVAQGLSRVQIDTRLNALLDEQQTLRARLDQWATRSADILGLNSNAPRMASRTRLADELWRHWRMNNLPELQRGPATLTLRDVALEDFPDSLPDFFLARVTHLALENVTAYADSHAAASGLTGNGQALERFLRPFAQVRALSLNEPASTAGLFPRFVDLPARVAASLPLLEELSLTGQSQLLDQRYMDALRPLTRLRRLDLSGNRFNPFMPLDLAWLPVERLVLERTGLDIWPDWLVPLLAGPLRELSLAHNRLSALPETILNNPAGIRPPRTIDLRGNPLTHTLLLRMRLSEQAVNASWAFTLDIPADLQTHLDSLLGERNALAEAIEGWVNASSSGAPLTAQSINERQRIGQALLEYWHVYTRGFANTPLVLEAVDLAQFPRRLPAFMRTRLRGLHLNRVNATPLQLDELLRRFPGLTLLEMEGHVRPMSELPGALMHLSGLRTLSLIDQGWQIDQAAIEQLGRLQSLEVLELDGNRLGEIHDASALRSQNLRWLSLRDMQLAQWPQWLIDLPSNQLETLILDNNRLAGIDEQLLANPRNEYHHCDISLLNNPLSHESLLRAHTSEAYNRTFTFQLDLPEDIRRIDWHEAHDSDSQTSGAPSPQHAHSPASHYSPATPRIDPWLDLLAPDTPMHRTVWQRLEQAPASRLLELVDQLRHTADFRKADSRPGLTERVWRVLQAADQDAELRATLEAIADEPLQQLLNADTCHDGVILEFNQMEVLVFTRQSLRDMPGEQRGASLLNLVRRLYRLQALDAVARAQAMGRDEAEVRLAYRLHAAHELDLPVPPRHMLYQAHANLRHGELDSALLQVRTGEQGDAFLEYAAGQDFWTGWLREQHAERFAALEQAYRDNLSTLSERFESLNDPAYERAARDLERQYVHDQKTLIKELTNLQASMSDH